MYHRLAGLYLSINSIHSPLLHVAGRDEALLMTAMAQYTKHSRLIRGEPSEISSAPSTVSCVATTVYLIILPLSKLLPVIHCTYPSNGFIR